MGKLSLNSKLFNSIIFKPFEYKNIVFKGPSGTTIGNFINAFDIFNVDINGVVNMYIGNLDTSPLITFLGDGSDWLNLLTEENVSNYVIPLNAIFQINSTRNLPVLLNLGGNASNYFQGQASIKKQNLTSLKVGGGTTVNNPSSVYVFKGGSINTLADIFNPINFQVNDTIFITSLELFLNEDYDFLFQVNDYGAGKYWTNNIYAQTNMNNYVIPVNYIIYFNTSNNNNIQVSNGAIIQRYSNGKINLNKKYLYKVTGTGLTPNINGLRFYDSGLIYNGKKSFYSEDYQYAIWYWGGFPTAIWLIGSIANIGTFTTNAWGKPGATDAVAGSYIAAGDRVGAVTVSAI